MKLIKLIGLVLIALAIASEVKTQELFKPGSTYLAGQEIQDVYGTVWKVKQRIGIAVSPPSQGVYYGYVRVQSPALATAPGYNVLDYGVKPGNTPEQNSTAIQDLINSFPEGATPSIYIPYGSYHFARQIHLYKRPIRLHGDNGTLFGNSTKLYFPAGVNGILIERAGESIQETIIERICLIGDPNSTTWASGIVSRARAKIRDCTTKGFSHNGIDFWANLEEGADASGSVVESCHSLENVHDGFFAGRVDGNAILFINNDARDNGRYGFNDDSFLGNNYIANMAHYNKAGDYYVRDLGNARSAFISCYAESGGVPSWFGPKTAVVGGFLASGYNKNDGNGIIYQ